MEVKEFCRKYNLSEDQFYGREEIGGWLYLSSLTSIPSGFNPTIGGSLDLSSYNTHPLPEGFNPTIGGYFYLRSGLKCDYTKLGNRILSWQNFKYIKADGIFSEVLEKKGYVYKLKSLSDGKISYLATDGDFHAHGETVEKAKEDLRFKKIAEKLKSEPITPDTRIQIQHYRIITGSCELGVNSWIDSNFKAEERDTIKREGILAKDLLPILERTNAYGLDKFKQLYK